MRRTKWALHTHLLLRHPQLIELSTTFSVEKSEKGGLGWLSQHHITGQFNTEATSELQSPKSYCGVFSVTNTDLNALESKTEWARHGQVRTSVTEIMNLQCGKGVGIIPRRMVVVLSWEAKNHECGSSRKQTTEIGPIYGLQKSAKP